jgi:two-component system, LytTR family, sensor kinase
MRLRTWGYIFATWALVGLFNAEQTYITLAVSGRATPFLSVLDVMAPGMVMWALFTPIVMWLAIRFPLDRTGVPVHIAALVVGAMSDAVLYNLIDPWVNPFGTRTLVAGFARYFSLNAANYIGIVAFSLVMRYASLLRERRIAAAELEGQLSTAHLRSLQSQLRPHFLFNTLNTIAELVHRDPDGADRMITRLGALLRRSFDTFGDQEVPLRAEIEFLRDYAEIVSARFQARIRIVMTIDPDTLDALVPSLILQPLVENAVRHGLEPKVSGGEVEIVARRRLDLLELEVRDDGLGVPRDVDVTTSRASGGVGLRNTVDRLRHLYGDAHLFAVRSRVRGGTIVAIQLPYRQGDAPPLVTGSLPSTHALELSH